jgi:hypothetical protein
MKTKLIEAMRRYIDYTPRNNSDFGLNVSKFLSSDDGYLLRNALHLHPLPNCDRLVALTKPAFKIAEIFDVHFFPLTLKDNVFDGVISKGKIVLIKDIVTTGKTTQRAIDYLKDQGCDVAAVFAVIDCLKASFSVPYSYLLDSNDLKV